jgi:hypothetical protein
VPILRSKALAAVGLQHANAGWCGMDVCVGGVKFGEGRNKASVTAKKI